VRNHEQHRRRHEDYLASAAWAERKEQALVAARHLCSICDGLADQVHHWRYADDLARNDDPRYQAAICSDCHILIHLVHCLHPDEFHGSDLTRDAWVWRARRVVSEWLRVQREQIEKQIVRSV